MRGTLQRVRRGKARRWIVLYNTKGNGRFHTLGTGDMSTTEAEKKRDEFTRTLNGFQEPNSDGTRPLKLREFIEQQHVLFCRKKWKASTAGTSEDRTRYHIINHIGDSTMRDFTLTSLQSGDCGKVIETSPSDAPLHAETCTEGTDPGHVGGRADNARRGGFRCSSSCARSAIF
jgi:hypothetical protein